MYQKYQQNVDFKKFVLYVLEVATKRECFLECSVREVYGLIKKCFVYLEVVSRVPLDAEL